MSMSDTGATLPAEAHVRAEDDDRSQVEEDPAEGQEDLELHSVDVAHLHRSADLPADPEEVQTGPGRCRS